MVKSRSKREVREIVGEDRGREWMVERVTKSEVGERRRERAFEGLVVGKSEIKGVEGRWERGWKGVVEFMSE